MSNVTAQANSITKKIQAIKDSAKKNLTPSDDYFNMVDKYIQEVKEIQENSKYHNEDKSLKLLEQLNAQIISINNYYEENKAEMTIKDKLVQIEDAYLKYAKKNASLERLGKATVFYDAVTAKYVRISRDVGLNNLGEQVERINVDRLKTETINKYIDRESKELTSLHIDTKKRPAIPRELKVFRKVFEPLRPTFYGESFNTYSPNGFLDIKVKNQLSIEKFTEITLPNRYPIINALLENIAPKIDERVFLLNWLSTILNTAKKTKTAIILKGIQRTGKGVFTTQIIEYAMHESNCFTATNGNLDEKYNNYLEDKLFITFDEVKGDFKHSNSLADTIKLIVSEERISIRSMNTDPYMINFQANCIFLSNNDLPVPMDQSDQRLSVIETKDKMLSKVANEMGIDTTHDFISTLKEERDAFLVHLKMCDFSQKMAMSVIDNSIKKTIQDATSTTQSVLKTAFRGQDIETIDEILEEAIQDTKNSILVKSEGKKSIKSDDVNIEVKDIIPFPYENIKMKSMFMEEFKSGLISNTSLKWFSIVTNIEHILKSDTKFGNFWNLVLNQATLIKLKWEDNLNTPEGVKPVEFTHSEKFRPINQHEELKTFHFNQKTFVFMGKKTAVELTQDIF